MMSAHVIYRKNALLSAEVRQGFWQNLLNPNNFLAGKGE